VGVAAKGKYTARLHPRGHGGKFIRGLPKLQTVKDRNRAISTLARFRHHVLDRQGAATYHHGRGAAPEHVSAVRGYFSGGYRDVNAALREGREHPDVAAVDAAFRPLEHDLVVSRHVGPEAFGLTDVAEAKDLVGKKITDAAYQAASVHDDNGQPGITMHVAVPKGVPAVLSEDGQILLQRDTELAIVDASPNGIGGWDVHAVLLKKPVSRGAGKPKAPESAAVPAVANETDLSKLTVPQLQAKAREAGHNPGRLRKAELLALLGGKAPANEPAAAPKVEAAKKVAPETVHAKLHQMIDAKTTAEAEKIAETLKGKDLEAALASTPVGKYVTAKDPVATKRRHLVRWATSADAANGDAIRRLGAPKDPGEAARAAEIDRAARRAEIKAPEPAAPKQPRQVAPAQAVRKPRAPRSASAPTAKPLTPAVSAHVADTLDKHVAAIDKAGGNSGTLAKLRQKAKDGTLTEQEVRDVVNSLAIFRMSSRKAGAPQTSAEKAEAAAGQALIAALSGPGDVKSLSEAEQVQAHLDSGITKRTKLSGGNIAKTDLVTTKDGHKLVVKTTGDKAHGIYGGAVRQQDAEELAALVAARMGLSAPGVLRTGPNEIVMPFKAGEPAVKIWNRAYEQWQNETEARAKQYQPTDPFHSPLTDLADSDQGKLVGLLDQVIDNGDRHQGNWLVGTDGKAIIPIDHGFSFGYQSVEQPVFTGVFAEAFPNYPGWKDFDISPGDMAQMRKILASLKPEFERLNRTDWYENALRRLEVMAPHAKGTVDRIQA
jgi:hypothetical protein